MGITIGAGNVPEPDRSPVPHPEGIVRLYRRWFVTDKDGVVVEIKSSRDIQRILDQMTPEQQAEWKTRYRFAPVENRTGNINYTGTNRDVC